MSSFVLDVFAQKAKHAVNSDQSLSKQLGVAISISLIMSRMLPEKNRGGLCTCGEERFELSKHFSRANGGFVVKGSVCVCVYAGKLVGDPKFPFLMMIYVCV